MLSANGFIPLEFDVLSLFLHVEVDHPVELLFVVLSIAAHKQALSCGCSCGTAIHVVCLSLVVFAPSHPADWAHTYVLVEEILVSEIVEEGCQVDHWAILLVNSVVFVINNVVLDLLNHCISNLLKDCDECFGSISLCTADALLELLIDFLSDSSSPSDDLVIDQLDAFVQVLSLLALLPQYCDLVVEGL